MVKHLVAQIGLDLDRRAENAHRHKKSPRDHGEDDAEHRHTDPIEQEIHVKRHTRAIDLHIPLIDAVDDHLIQVRDHELQIVHHHEGRQAQAAASQRI